ncbi:RING finger protein [Rhizoctonia solani]|uniref:RING finger protein n=1 Tax=Rhizoctonia solani TaxID=456999 RepID=A0A8H8NVQ0_9AGAM|nr:RING finger protein [Rhizoctonia solani]QRW20956.1 RING finger protein [Rhizoctonia solani]
MKYGKTYSSLLSTPTWPQEWKDLALDYRGLKKLVNGVVDELSAQGLNHEVLLSLLEAEREFEEHETLVLGDTHRPFDPANQKSSHGSFLRSRAHYEFISDKTNITPQLRIWLHSEPGGPSSDLFRPSLLHLRSNPNASHIRTSTEYASCEDALEAARSAPNLEAGPGGMEEPALMSASVELVSKPNPLYALKSNYESNPHLGASSVHEVDNATDLRDATDLDKATLTSNSLGHADREPSKLTRDIEVVLPLTADTAFHRVLATALSSLASLRTRTQTRVSDQISGLADTISSCSGPPARDRKSDLYAWREIFQLWVECQIYQGGATERERANGEGGIRDVAEAEKRLGMFASEVVKRGLGDRRTMKSAKSRDALQTFLNLNLHILDLKKFELANAEAARKILKKHEKRTALPTATSLAVLPISRGTGELPQMLITTLTQTLLPVLPSLEDYSCLICTSIAFKPIRLSCGHLFCVRSPCVLIADGSNLDVSLMNFMKEWFPKETKEKSDSNDRAAAGRGRASLSGMWGSKAILVLAATFASLVAALPATNTTLPIVVKRSISGATGSDCNGYTFTAAQVSAAAQESLSHVLAGTTVGTNKYPHVLDNREGFTYPAGCTVTRYEFPIFRNKIYTGGDPSVDRVIIGHVSGSSAYSCGVLTHQGASGNNFLQCDNV